MTPTCVMPPLWPAWLARSEVPSPRPAILTPPADTVACAVAESSPSRVATRRAASSRPSPTAPSTSQPSPGPRWATKAISPSNASLNSSLTALPRPAASSAALTSVMISARRSASTKRWRVRWAESGPDPSPDPPSGGCTSAPGAEPLAEGDDDDGMVSITLRAADPGDLSVGEEPRHRRVRLWQRVEQRLDLEAGGVSDRTLAPGAVEDQHRAR